VPTVWGWLALIVAGAVIFMQAGRALYPFLATDRPVGARLLVVEGWMSAAELRQAIDVYRRGGYERMVTSGGPIEDDFECTTARSYAERARAYVVAHGMTEEAVVAVPAPASAQDRSYLNAVMVREWAMRSMPGVDALDVVSAGPHSRRTWLLYGRAFGPRVRVGIIAATPTEYDPGAWWRKSIGAKDVLMEAIGWAWTELFFHPAPPGSQDEIWGGARGVLLHRGIARAKM